MLNVDSNIEFFCLIVPITLLTWICACDNCLAVSTSGWVNCFLPLVKGGNLTSVQQIPTESCTVNPRSAKIKSPGSR